MRWWFIHPSTLPTSILFALHSAAGVAAAPSYPLGFGAWLPPPTEVKTQAMAMDVGKVECSDFTNCFDCASNRTWTGQPCRWCPLPNDNHCHAEGSLANKCSKDQQITDLTKCPKAPSSRAPVVILPGIVGSNIQATLDKPSVVQPLCTKKQKDWYYVWLESFEVAPGAVKCLFDNLKLVHLGDGNVTNQPGVTTRIDDFGGLGDIGCAMPKTKALCSATTNWQQVTDLLLASGYTAGVDLFGAPFDWRYGPRTWMHREFPQLKALIERAYRSANNTKVVLQSISLGGPYGHAFLTQYVNQTWKDTFIESWLSISSVWNGAGEVVQMLTAGLAWDGIKWIQATAFRDGVQNWPAMAFMLPHVFVNSTNKTVDDVWIKTPNATYTTSQFHEMLLAAGFNDTAEIYETIKPYQTSHTQPGVKTYCWYGTGTPTTEGMVFPSNNLSTGGVPVMGDGDGTVHHSSLKVCEQWVGKGNYETVVQVFPNVTHVGFLTDVAAQQEILKVVSSAGARR